MDSPEAQRLRVALDLYEAGVQMLRQRLRRERPAASETEIDAAVNAWLLVRPGAVDGDCIGRPSHRFERNQIE